MEKSSKKKVVKVLALFIEGGKATPAPPVGPMLGAAKVNIMAFCKEFNDRTKDQMGVLLRVLLTIYSGGGFSIQIKKSPVSYLISKAIGLEKGSSNPNRESVGELTKEQVKEIAAKKMDEMNARTMESAMRTVEGTARSMGVQIGE